MNLLIVIFFMKCSNCGSIFRIDYARAEFISRFDGDEYNTEHNGFCGDCAHDNGIEDVLTIITRGELMLKKLKKWDMSLNIIIGSFIGVFIGHSLYRYFDYKKYPGLYELQSALWYTSIQTNALVAGVVILIAIILKFLIKKKLKNY